MRSSYPKLELLNFEGPVLSATKYQNLFIITDQWKEIVAVLIDQEFTEFMKGRFYIIDSQNKRWNITEQHEDARPSEEKIKEFISM